MTRCVAFVGAPGSSKTTQIRMLQTALPRDAVLVASVPRLLRREPELAAALTRPMSAALDALVPDATACRDRGELAPLDVDRLLLRIIEGIDSVDLVALDACPRGVAQALVFLSRPRLIARTHVFHLRLPGDEVAWSLRRQWERAAAAKGAAYARANVHVFERKTRVYVENTLRGIALLGAWNARVTDLDAREPADSLHQQVMKHLGLSSRGAPAPAFAYV